MLLALLAVELEHGQGFLMVLAQAVADDLFVVIAAAGGFGALEQARGGNILGNVEIDETVERGVEFDHETLEDVGLHEGAGESVEEETRCIGVLDDGFFDDLDDDFVGDQPAGGHGLAHFPADVRVVFDLLAQELAGGDVDEVETLDEVGGMGALARAGRTEECDVEHGGCFC